MSADIAMDIKSSSRSSNKTPTSASLVNAAATPTALTPSNISFQNNVSVGRVNRQQQQHVQSVVDQQPSVDRRRDANRIVPASRKQSSYGSTASGGGRGRYGNSVALEDAITDDCRLDDIDTLSRPNKKYAVKSVQYVKQQYERDSYNYHQHFRHATHNGHHHHHYHNGKNTYAIKNYNKECFLRANCQFLVIDGYEYDEYLTADAEMLVEWDRIEEVRLFTHQPPNCPICLSAPTAAKITRCGHIFCWPCMLHYLSLADETWRKCPICYESVYVDQLKSVSTVVHKTMSVDDRVTLQLVQRSRASAIVKPAEQYDGVQQMKVAKAIKTNANFRQKFDKLLIVDACEAKSQIVDRERRELECLWREEKDEPESCFIISALTELDERVAKLKEHAKSIKQRCDATPVAIAIIDELKPIEVVDSSVYFDDEDEKGKMSTAASIDLSVVENCDSNLNDDISNASAAHESITHSTTTTANNTYFFYQADDGQPIYLHPINAKCLVHEYGSLEQSPTTITGRILQLDNYSMTAELRDRHRYLAHLPLTTHFILAELRLDKKYLSHATVSHFAGLSSLAFALSSFLDEFVRRRNLREKQKRIDDRRDHLAQLWERALLCDPENYSQHCRAISEGSAHPPAIPFSTYVQSAQSDIDTGRYSSATANYHPKMTPSFTALTLVDDCDGNFPALNESGGGEAMAVANVSPMSKESVVVDDDDVVPSFAQMLKSRPKLLSPPSSIDKSRLKSTTSNNMLKLSMESADDDAPAPDFRNAFGDALQSALDSVEKRKTDETIDADRKGRKKKGKKSTKGIVLFTTA